MRLPLFVEVIEFAHFRSTLFPLVQFVCNNCEGAGTDCPHIATNEIVPLQASVVKIKKLIQSLVFLAGIAVVMHPLAEGLPDLGDSADASLSELQEKTIGARIMMEIRNDSSYIDDAELSAYIKGLGGRLVAASRGATNNNRREFEFFLLKDDSINAFALPGGYIGVHSGLLLTSTTEAELSGVLGHEIAHVLQRHQARGIDSQKGNTFYQLLGVAVAVLASRSNSSSGGQAAEAAIATTVALQYQSQLNYSRDFEREADRMGIQVLARAGFEPVGMVGFFERMLRANRHNEGKMPQYLLSHPLTTERIADMQDRVGALKNESTKFDGGESPEYKFARAKLRVMSMSASEAVSFFRTAVAERTVLRDRADVYGLGLALMRAREFAAAEKEIATLRSTGARNGWIDNLAAETQAAQRNWPEALKIYRAAMLSFPQNRALLYGYVDTLYEANEVDQALAHVTEQLKNTQDDPRLYELAAKGYERKNKRMAQHRAVGEAYFRKGNLIGAVDQLELASKAKDGDFYEISTTEARLREMKTVFRNRTLLPGEKKDPERDKKEFSAQ